MIELIVRLNLCTQRCQHHVENHFTVANVLYFLSYYGKLSVL